MIRSVRKLSNTRFCCYTLSFHRSAESQVIIDLHSRVHTFKQCVGVRGSGSDLWVGEGKTVQFLRFYIVTGECFNVKLIYCHHILVWLILQGTKIRRTLLCQQCSIEIRNSEEHLFTISLKKGKNASEQQQWQWQCTTATVYMFNV